VPSIELDSLLRPDFSPLCSFDARISQKYEVNRFHVLRVGDDFWLRLENHPDWLALFPSDEFLQRWTNSNAAHQPLREHLQMLLEERVWGRVLSLFDESGHLWRVAWKGKQTFLLRPDTGEAVDFRSDDEWKRGAWIQAGAYFLKRFARQWNNPASDVRAAKSFLEADDETRRLWGLGWEVGNWPELRRILRAATIVEHEFGERTVVQARPVYPLGQRQLSFSSNAPQSGRSIRLFERLEERNVAVLKGKSKLRRLAPRPFEFQCGVAKWPQLRVEVEAPSQHEKLEARLELRDWLRENAVDLLDEWDD